MALNLSALSGDVGAEWSSGLALVALTALACAVGHVATSKLLASNFEWYRAKVPADRAYYSQLVVSSFAITYSVHLFVRGMLLLPAGALARHFGSTPLHATAIDVAVGFHLYEIAIYLLNGKALIFWVHHVVAMGALITSRLTEQQMQIIAWQYSCEITGPFLAAVLIMQQDPSLKSSAAYTAAGTLLWASFLVARVLSLLACAVYFAHDLFYTLPAIGRYDDLHLIHRYLALPSTILIWAMSVVWFWPITHGLLKALGWAAAKPPAAKAS